MHTILFMLKTALLFSFLYPVYTTPYNHASTVSLVLLGNINLTVL